MMQQSARYIIDKLVKRKNFDEEFLQYLNDLDKKFAKLPLTHDTHRELLSLESIEEALRIRSAYFIYCQFYTRYS
jgi:hypothetical protein